MTGRVARWHQWWWDGVWLLVWIAASSAWCITAAQQLSATFDEPFYVASGLESWRTGSHAALLRKGTMPLPPDVQTLPLYLWERSTGVVFDARANLHGLLPWARAATLAFWSLVLLYGLLIARQIGGEWSGRLAVALLACEPSLLAHASLATTDIAVSACLLALAYHFRAGRDAAWMWRIGVPAICFAAAVLAKASAVVMGLLWLVVIECERLWRAGAFARKSQLHAFRTVPWARYLNTFTRDCATIVGLAVVVVFVFCGSDWRAEPSFVAWAQGLPDGGLREWIVWVSEHLRIFSNAGEALVRQTTHNFRGHGAYILGVSDPRALWYYFPLVLSIKLSEALLLMLLMLAVVRPRTLTNWACLAAGATILLSVTFRVQLGIRMLLPAVALLIAGLAAAVTDAMRDMLPARHRAATGIVCGVVAWALYSAWSVWPQGLAYVNHFWGGTWDGYALVSDANYDWGQGLKELQRWAHERNLADLRVWYFGTDPTVADTPLQPLPLHGMQLSTPADVTSAVRGHCVAVSTTILYGVDPDIPAYRTAVAFLHAHQPDARTTTFFIYDFAAGGDSSASACVGGSSFAPKAAEAPFDTPPEEGGYSG